MTKIREDIVLKNAYGDVDLFIQVDSPTSGLYKYTTYKPDDYSYFKIMNNQLYFSHDGIKYNEFPGNNSGIITRAIDKYCDDLMLEAIFPQENNNNE